MNERIIEVGAIPGRDYLGEAESILAGTSMFLPEVAHLRALADEGVRVRRDFESIAVRETQVRRELEAMKWVWKEIVRLRSFEVKYKEAPDGK